MARTVPEWIGKTDDTPIPPRVKLRVFEEHRGICHISGQKIQVGQTWQCDHINPLILGGEHRESNLAPALTEPHKAKTAGEVKAKAKIAKVRQKHLGIKGSKQQIKGAGFAKAPPQRSASRPLTKRVGVFEEQP
jgi:5-methylcytosine-specific restriction protein A